VGDPPAPDVAICVPTRGRALRLRWLLNSLALQTTDSVRFEVVVGIDPDDAEAMATIAEHAMSADGRLRSVVMPSPSGPAAKRNAAWRASVAPMIVFTDDDCRPPGDWLERLAEAARRHPGAVVQGATKPDPDEAALMLASPFHRTQSVDPPEPWGQTCNIAYPRALLELVGGFDESFVVASGEDTDLLHRARDAGAEYVGATDALTFHAVEPMSLGHRLREAWRWRHVPALAARHARHRRELYLGVFQKRSHAWFLLACLGLLASRRHPAFALLALVWVRGRAPYYGPSLRGRIRSASELPGRFALDAVEVAAYSRGSIEHRTLVL